MKKDSIIAGISQISPVWLDKKGTIEKVLAEIEKAAKKNVDLLTFAEALIPGYPFWPEITNGAVFNSDVQKDFFARYVREAVQIEKGELDAICNAARKHNMAIYLGIIERAANRGNHSVYASLVFIDRDGLIKSVHRKMMPTYDERLVWSIGDGNGLVTHPLESFCVGGLNCWENWMPMARASLYGQGENIHVMVWPGSVHNTELISRFVAKESRSYVISASSPFTKKDIPDNIPHYDLMMKNAPEVLTNGGSCIVGPDGEWIVEPVMTKETLITAQLDYGNVLRERHNFDPSGHYSRPDVMQLSVNRKRQSTVEFND